MSKRNIMFVGDSYCCAFTGPSPNGRAPYQGTSSYLTWLDISADALNLDLYCFGYAGRSWWNSRWNLMRHLDAFPDALSNTDVIVFVHTDSLRYNTVVNDIGNELMFDPPRWSPDPEIKVQQQVWAPALKYWFTDLRDNHFQDWCQEKWIEEINQMHDANPHLKIIHFNSFHSTVDRTKKAKGMVFSTPLIHVSLGEADGTDEHITNRFMVHDQRSNHFNHVNNLALGKFLVDAVIDYAPGIKEIDTSGFRLVNPNSHNWPNPGFGTK